MVTQDLLDYIRKKQENGISQIQIEQVLTAKGWTKNDIKKGFYAYKLLISPEPKSFISKRKTNRTPRFMFLFLFLLTLGFVFYYLSVETIYLDQIKFLFTKQNNSTDSYIQPTPTQPISPDFSRFLDNLEKCIPGNLEFTHPLTGDLLQKQIIEFVDDKCTYREEMPNDGLMECFYSLDDLPQVAKYYKSTETNQTHLESSQTVDGQPTENLLQSYLDDGTCIISGYQD